MSLVASIFGSEPKAEDPLLVSLFDKTTTPSAAVVVSQDSKKKKDEPESDSSSDSDDSSSSSDNSDCSPNNKKENDAKKSDTKQSKLEKKAEDNVKAKQDDETPKIDSEQAQETAIVKDSNDTHNSSNNIKDSQLTREDEEERTVFVGNLPLSTTRRSLAKVFAECGKVQSTRLRSVAVAGIKVPQNRAGDQNLVRKVCTFTKQLDTDAKSSLQGYVVFVSKEAVPKALALNNKALQDESPQATRAIRRIRVDTASPENDPKRSVFVGNLPYQADEATLADHFVQGCALEPTDIQGVRIIRDKETFQCKGFGYVLFEDSTMVATALQRMQNSLYMRRPLRVKVCGKTIKGRRGQDKKRHRDIDPTPTTTRKENRNDASRDGDRSSKRPRQSLTDDNKEGDGKKRTPTPVEGAMKRVKKKNKRVRGEKKKNLPPGAKPGVSKRAAADAKTDKRVKKLQKRVSKGMGKARKSS